MLDKATLGGFIGTEGYHRWSPLFRNYVLTDGAMYVAKNGGGHGAFWLMDAIASYWPKIKKLGANHSLRSYQFWKLKVVLGNRAVLTCQVDSDRPPTFTQEIEYTDFDLPEIDLWVQPADETTFVIMLPSEY